MKKFLLFLTLLISAIGLTHAAETTATLTFTDTDGDGKVYDWDVQSGNGAVFQNIEFTEGDITIKYTTDKKLRFWKDGLRFYSTGGITISVPTGKYITKISITSGNNKSFTINNDKSTNLSQDWKNANTTINSVTLNYTPSEKNQPLQTLTVTYNDVSGGEEPTLTDPEITWTLKTESLADNALVKATLNGTNTLPTLSFADGAPVTCKSSNEAVATVTDGGEVTIIAAGTTIITASTPADHATFKQASKSYTLTVIDPSKATYTIVVADITGLKSGNAIGTFTFNSITFSSTGAKYYNSSTPYTIRMYNGNTMSIKAPDGYYIQKIELTSTEGDLTKFTASTNGTLTNANKILTWTLNDGAVTSQTVEIKNGSDSSNTTKFTKFVVYCAKDSNLKDAEFAFKSTTVNKWIDDAAFTNTLTYAEGITDGIVYSIVNPEDVTVAEINPSTGEVTIKGVGTATITATRAEDSTFKKGEASYTLVVSKRPHGLAYTPSSISLTPGEELAEQPTLKNDNTLVVTYSSSNEAVATVTDDGTISIAGATGQAVISATFAGNDTYEAGSATFTISVREPIDQVANFSLVTNIKDLQAGDIIVIACPEKTKVMSTEVNTTIRPSVIATFSDDKSTLTTPADGLQLQVEKSDDDYWMFRTTNYGTNGYLSSSSTAKNCIISETVTDNAKATIELSATGVATILFNKGAESTTSPTIWLTYNSINNKTNEGRFSCYASNFTGANDIFIYKFESNQQTIVGEDLTEVTISEPTGASSIDAMSIFETNSSADTFVVKMNGVEITSANVTKEVDTSTTLTVSLSGLPYIPGAEFTIAPVVNGKEGHSEVLGIHMPALPTFTVTDSSRELMFNDEEATAGTCNIDAVIKLYVTSTAGEGAYGFNYYFDFENLSGFENHHWDWLNDSKGNGVTYVVEDYLTNVTTQAQGEAENVVYVPVLPSEDTSYPELVFNLKPYFVFNVTPELASLITEATPAPMAAPARAGEAFVLQNVYSTQVFEQHFNFSATTDVSGVEGVAVDGGAAVEYFNLQGVRVDGDLAPGIYIRRQGQSVSKVQIR